MADETKETEGFSKKIRRTLWAMAFALVGAIGLVFTGWYLAQGAEGGARAVREEAEKLHADIVETSAQFEARLNTRLDKIEGKIDALLKIATAVPPDLNGAPAAR